MWFLFVVYHCMHYPFFGVTLDLPLVKTVEMVSYIHSMVAVTAAFAVWLHRSSRIHGIEVPEMLIYEHSLTYFALDMLINMVWFQHAFYFVHHIVALVILVQMYAADVTGDAILLGIILFEITNPIKRFETLYLMHRDYTAEARTCYTRRAFQVLFYITFVVIRCMMIPWLIYTVYDDVTLKMNIYGKAAYTVAVILLIFGGALWSRDIVSKVVRQHSHSLPDVKKE